MSDITDKLLNFLIRLWEIWTSSKVGKIGKYFMYIGFLLVMSGGIIDITYINPQRSLNGSYDMGDADSFLYCLGVVFMIIGAYILIQDYKKIRANKVMFYFANMMPFGDSKTPLYAMNQDDRISSVETYLKKIDSYSKDEVINNFRFNQELFKERIEHKNIENIYLAGLGSVPYLYLLGTLVRNGHILCEVLDYERNSKKWYRLPDIGNNLTHSLMYENKTIDKKIDEIIASESELIGVALSYTFQIYKESVPEGFEDNTLYLQHSGGFGNDKLSNKMSQKALIDELVVYIDRLKAANKKIHFFISAQASMCINLGARYQDMTIGEISVYNFNSDRVRDWYITFDRGNVS